MLSRFETLFCFAFLATLGCISTAGCGTPTPPNPAAIFAAIDQDSPFALSAALPNGISDYDLRTPTGDTPLHAALTGRRRAAARWLIEHGANLRHRGGDRCPPLQTLVEQNPTAAEDLALVELLLVHGAPVSLGRNQVCAPDDNAANGWTVSSDEVHLTTPLHDAVRLNNLLLVKLLSAHGAAQEMSGFIHTRGNPRTPLAGTPLFFALETGADIQIVAELLRAGADPNRLIFDRDAVLSPLMLAVGGNNCEAVQLLLDRGTDPQFPTVTMRGKIVGVILDPLYRTPPDQAIMDLLTKAGYKPPPPPTADQLRQRQQVQEIAAWMNLSAVARAQHVFFNHKQQHFFTASGHALHQYGTLIAGDLRDAFENHHGNGDAEKGKPIAGYLYRMLQGVGDNPTSFADPANPTHLTGFGATCRPADNISVQYYVTADEQIYRHADPGVGKFLLEACPTAAFLADPANGWSLIRREDLPPWPESSRPSPIDPAAVRHDTPLIAAVRAGNAQILAQRITAGDPVDQPNRLGETALFVALDTGRLALADTLLSAGADPNRMAATGFTPFHLAVTQGNQQLVALMLKRGADIDLPARCLNHSEVGLPERFRGDAQFVTAYSMRGGAPEFTGSSLRVAALPPCHLAAMFGLAPMLKQLVAAGANTAPISGVGCLWSYTNTTLAVNALVSGDPTTLDYTLSLPSTFLQPDDSNPISLLKLAVSFEDTKQIETLLGAGYDPTAVTEKNLWSPYSDTWFDSCKNGPAIRALFRRHGFTEDGTDRMAMIGWSLHGRQREFFKQHQAYARGGRQCTPEFMRESDWPQAFAEFSGNGDAEKPAPTWGCILRVLAGPAPADHPDHCADWAGLIRSAEPATWQLLIASDGRLYRRADPTGQAFLIDRLPTPAELARDWKPLPPPWDQPVQYEEDDPEAAP